MTVEPKGVLCVYEGAKLVGAIVIDGLTPIGDPLGDVKSPFKGTGLLFLVREVLFID